MIGLSVDSLLSNLTEGPNSSYPELFVTESRNVGPSFYGSSDIVYVLALRDSVVFFSISVVAVSTELLLNRYICVTSKINCKP